MSPTGPTYRPSRRIVFQGLGALGVAAALAGCGGDDGDGGGGAPEPESGAGLAATADVPVGGGVVLPDENIVITQPTEGEFVAFSATCTHQGSPLDAVGDDGIQCPLHGSRFSIEDGSVTTGPATESLSRVEITVDGDQIVAT